MLVFDPGNSDRLQLSAPITTTAAKVGQPSNIANANLVTVQLVTTDSAGVQNGGSAGGVQGTWKFEVSNSYAGMPETLAGANSLLGVWNDITADISPAVPAADGTGQNYVVSFIDFGFRHFRVTFTPTSGTGAAQRAWAYVIAKSYGN